MITTENYELYFFQYQERMLSEAEREEVEAFAAEHPDLAEEMALYAEAPHLSPREVSFPDKEALRHRTTLVWWHYAAAAVVVAVLATGGIRMMFSSPEGTMQVAETKSIGVEKEIEIPTLEKPAEEIPCEVSSQPQREAIAQADNSPVETLAEECEMAVVEPPLEPLVAYEEPVEDELQEIPMAMQEEPQEISVVQAEEVQAEETQEESHYVDCMIVVHDYSEATLGEIAMDLYPRETEQLVSFVSWINHKKEEIYNSKIFQFIQAII